MKRLTRTDLRRLIESVMLNEINLDTIPADDPGLNTFFEATVLPAGKIFSAAGMPIHDKEVVNVPGESNRYVVIARTESGLVFIVGRNAHIPNVQRQRKLYGTRELDETEQKALDAIDDNLKNMPGYSTMNMGTSDGKSLHAKVDSGKGEERFGIYVVAM